MYLISEVIEFRLIRRTKINLYYLHFIPKSYITAKINKFSVILYLFDAASRYVFRKQMKKTIRTLKKIRKKNYIYEMLRYHSVGPNSIHNYLPLFYGTNDTSNKHKIIFQNFEEKGFISITLLEDCHNRTELYGNTTYKGSDHNIILGCEFNNHFLYGNKPRCIGNKHYHQLYLDYLNEAVMYYNNKSAPYISYTSFMEPHEEFHISLLRVDKDFSDHLYYLFTNNILNNAIIIMLSDHGINYGPYFNTNVSVYCNSL